MSENATSRAGTTEGRFVIAIEYERFFRHLYNTIQPNPRTFTQ